MTTNTHRMVTGFVKNLDKSILQLLLYICKVVFCLYVIFSLSDAILILFLHDLEKPFRYIEPK